MKKNDIKELYSEGAEIKSLNEEIKEIEKLSLDELKAQIEELSGAEKLKLFNWLKSSGSTSKSGTVKNVGVGDFVREKIFEGLSNNEIVESCKEKYGNEQTTYNCIVWYRNKMKKEGLV